MDGWMKGQTAGLMDRHGLDRLDRLVGGWMEGLMDGWMDGWMDGRMDWIEWIDW